MELSSRYGGLDIVSVDEESLDVLINTSDDYAFADFVEVYKKRWPQEKFSNFSHWSLK